jgi:hypothetical protein
MQTANRRSWKIFIPVIAVLVLAVLWSIYWFIAIGVAERTAVAQRQQLAGQGLTISCTSEAWGGYPFRFEFRCTSPVIKYREKAELRSANLQAVALAYNPRQIVLLLDGPTTASGEGLPPHTITHNRAIASVTFDLADRSKFSLDAEAANIENQELLSIGRLMINSRPAEQGGIDLAALVEQFSRRNVDKPEFRLARMEFLGTLSPTGTLSISKIEASQDGVRYWGSGELALDQSRRVTGKVATETNDLAGLLRIIEPQTEMTEQQRANLRMVLGLLGKNAKADIVAKDGQLFVGPVKAADLQPLF